MALEDPKIQPTKRGTNGVLNQGLRNKYAHIAQ
jgi:hypothetical protein